MLLSASRSIAEGHTPWHRGKASTAHAGSDCAMPLWLGGVKGRAQELTAGLNWRTTRSASSPAWYSTMPTLLCAFTMSQRRCLPAAQRDPL